MSHESSQLGVTPELSAVAETSEQALASPEVSVASSAASEALLELEKTTSFEKVQVRFGGHI